MATKKVKFEGKTINVHIAVHEYVPFTGPMKYLVSIESSYIKDEPTANRFAYHLTRKLLPVKKEK